MENCPIVIVGAGPAGLTLALSLALHQIHSVILEKELGVSEDPRGVALTGDAVRICYQIGIGEEMDNIGHRIETVNFHRSTFKNPPFLSIDQTHDTLQQAVPDGILQIQPKLESALRKNIENSPYCTLRCGSTVFSKEELDDGVIVEYHDDRHKVKHIKCSYLIGADGKTGVVRKRFLEQTAGIRQEVGLFKYNGTWVAANLKIHLPTPETHPDFPLWKLDFTPEAVYDLFWPAGWHFCSPPGKATACGRFGPTKERFWRHEFAEPDWDNNKDSEALLWEHLLPMLTRTFGDHGRQFPEGEVVFPQDCIEIRRCRLFTFCQKVVNKWFHKRIILIGDAAHVFPPFGGQGIACGIRDAHALAWRLAVLQNLPKASQNLSDKLLEAWSLERRQGVDDSVRLTKQNGMLCNKEETWGFFFLRKAFTLAGDIGILRNQSQLYAARERAGYKKTPGGFFLAQYGGGGKLAQIYVRSATPSILLSDELLKRQNSVMTLLIVSARYRTADEADVLGLLKKTKIPQSILSANSLISISEDEKQAREAYRCCSERDLSNKKLRPGYAASSYIGSLPQGTKYAIVRPDFIVFAIARSLEELSRCFEGLNVMLSR